MKLKLILFQIYAVNIWLQYTHTYTHIYIYIYIHICKYVSHMYTLTCTHTNTELFIGSWYDYFETSYKKKCNGKSQIVLMQFINFIVKASFSALHCISIPVAVLWCLCVPVSLQSLPCSLSADSSLVPSQWEEALLCNDVSHWLGTSLKSALLTSPISPHAYSIHVFNRRHQRSEVLTWLLAICTHCVAYGNISTVDNVVRFILTQPVYSLWAPDSLSMRGGIRFYQFKIWSSFCLLVSIQNSCISMALSEVRGAALAGRHLYILCDI